MLSSLSSCWEVVTLIFVVVEAVVAVEVVGAVEPVLAVVAVVGVVKTLYWCWLSFCRRA